MVELLEIDSGNTWEIKKPDLELYRGDVICYQDRQYRVVYKKYHPVQRKMLVVVRKEVA